jgi:two-component system, OmpR family, sensor histidine kinase TctE
MTATSLRGHLLALLLPVAIIALLVNALAVYLIALDASADSLDEGLADAAEIYIERLRDQPGDPPNELPAEAQRVLLAMPEDRIFFSLEDAAGRLLAGEGRLGDDLPWGSLRKPAFFDLNRHGYWLRAISVVFESGGVARHLTLATTALKREALMGEIMLGMVAPQVVLFLVTMVLVWAGIRQGLAPLADLQAEIGQRSHHDLRPLETAAPDELQPIVGELNGLFGRLDSAIEAQGHFIADAAHQLRTPIAGLLAQLEAAGPTANPALLATARRLARLVTQLLALSRAEPGVEPRMEDFDLAALIRDAANDWLPRAFRRDIEVHFELAETRLFGSQHACREMLANLVDNAIRYGRQGGNIFVRCFGEDDEAVLQVEDDGPGIPVAERQRVFERFHRGKDASADGCGLGLPIVAALARQHGGKVSLGGTPSGGGLRVEVRLPRTAARGSGA